MILEISELKLFLVGKNQLTERPQRFCSQTICIASETETARINNQKVA
jgi:hypothetical protein